MPVMRNVLIPGNSFDVPQQAGHQPAHVNPQIRYSRHVDRFFFVEESPPARVLIPVHNLVRHSSGCGTVQESICYSGSPHFALSS